MKFGILRDIKNGEFRVIATPTEVGTLVADGNEVYVCRGAGYKAGFDDEDYAKAGGKLVDTNEEIYAACDFVAKVKEIEESEYGLLREGQIIYTCIHPAAHRAEVDALLEKKVIAFTAEEWGAKGASAYISALTSAERSRIRGMLNLDMFASARSPHFRSGELDYNNRGATLCQAVF